MEMNHYERAMAALKGDCFDYAPAMNFTSIVTKETLDAYHFNFATAHTDASSMAALAEKGHTDFGFDTISPYFSVHLESAALGVKIDWGNNYSPPRVVCPAFSKLDDIEIPINVMQEPAIVQTLKALQILKRRYHHKVCIIGKVIGPWSLAYHLYGAERLILDMILEPEKTSQKIQELSQLSTAFAFAQFQAGADAIVWAEHATSDLVSAEIYKEFLFPVHQKAMRRLSPHGPVILHMCGNIEDRLHHLIDAGFDCIHLDSRNNMEKISAIANGNIRLASCINNPVTLLRGNSFAIKQEVSKSFSYGISMIGPECAIPLNVPNQNLQLLRQIAHSHSYQDTVRLAHGKMKD